MKFRSRHALFCLVLAACHKNPAPAPGSSAAAGNGTPGAAGNSLAILDGFEGEIGMSAKGKMSGKQAAAAPTNFTLQVKGGKFRVDLPDSLANEQGVGKAYALVAPADKKLYLVMDAKKQIILVDFDKVANQAKLLNQAHSHGPGGAGETGSLPQMQKTGKLDTVAGYSCEIWHISKDKSSADLCIAEQGTSWFKIPLTGIPAEYAWASEITDGKHFPLRFVMSENGVEQGRLEVTSIQKQPLPAASFTPPPGYNTIDLEQMLAGMLGGIGMMPGMAPSGTPPGFPPGMLPPASHAHAPKKP
ncbi:MAG TPA: DUF4412 domain-containing protein [Polyangiaceae bacterium]|jgi:hypothetical protein